MIHWNEEDETNWFHWTSLEYYPCRELGMKLVGVYGSDFWIGADDISNESFTKLEPTLYIRPISEVDIELQARYHELQHYYIARVYEARIKVQFHRNFWFRLNAQMRDYDIAENTITSMNFYPLFGYQPNSAISLYAGASADETETSQSRNTMLDQTTRTWFIKASYTFDLL
jgi:hypothetical protein